MLPTIPCVCIRSARQYYFRLLTTVKVFRNFRKFVSFCSVWAKKINSMIIESFYKSCDNVRVSTFGFGAMYSINMYNNIIFHHASLCVCNLMQ